MVSMGETRAMIPIYEALKKEHPNAQYYFSSTTKTGHEEALRRYPNEAGHFYLPLDLSQNMGRLVSRIKPDLLILAESDFWFHMIQKVKRGGGRVVVLNGKISETSKRRFARWPRLAKHLFGPIDLFCIQNEEYLARFQELAIAPEKMTVTGNVKLGVEPPRLSEEEKSLFRKELGLEPEDRVVTLGSTHEGEEKILLDQIGQIPSVKFLLVPRHPERFKSVKRVLDTLDNPQIILVDRMGVLNQCYQISDLALVGGSFVPGVGGHNIFEPIQAQIPVLFGPFMETQQELVEMILKADAGLQIPHQEVASTLSRLLVDPAPYLENAKHLSQKGKEVVEKTFNSLIALS